MRPHEIGDEAAAGLAWRQVGVKLLDFVRIKPHRDARLEMPPLRHLLRLRSPMRAARSLNGGLAATLVHGCARRLRPSIQLVNRSFAAGEGGHAQVVFSARLGRVRRGDYAPGRRQLA